MKKFETVLLFLITITASAFGQSALKVYPDTLKYTDKFNRLQHLFIYNEGNDDIVIDSIYIDESIYFPRFDRDPVFPLTIPPSDSLVMDCVFWNFWGISYGAYDSAIVIYSSSADSIVSISSKVNINNIFPGKGIIEGTVTSGGNPLQNTKLLFYRNGINLIDSTNTDEEGFFSINLLAGNYFAAAEKDEYYISYNYNRTSPVDADFIELNKDSTVNINFDLSEVASTDLSIKGNILDKVVNGLAKRRRSGVVVARKGDHNPSKISNTYSHSKEIYTGSINSDGSYSVNNIQEPGYYYIQAFAEFYIPGFYSESLNSTFFWQDADSVYVGGELTDYDIYLERDSSYGGGNVSGKINTDLDSNFVSTIVYAQSVEGNIYTHNFVDAQGNYKITGLPYGQYKIIAQALDYKDAVSDCDRDTCR